MQFSDDCQGISRHFGKFRDFPLGLLFYLSCLYTVACHTARFSRHLGIEVRRGVRVESDSNATNACTLLYSTDCVHGWSAAAPVLAGTDCRAPAAATIERVLFFLILA